MSTPATLNVTAADVRMMVMDPVRFLQKIKDMRDWQPEASIELLAAFLGLCKDIHWVLLREAGVIQVVLESALLSSIASTKIGALNAYTSCLKLILSSPLKKAEGHYNAVKNALNAAREIYPQAWAVMIQMPLDVGKDVAEAFRLAVYRSLEQLVKLREEDGPPFDDDVPFEDDGETFINGELLLANVLAWSPAHCLALYCWIFASDSDTRQESDAVRCLLLDADLDEGYEMGETQFIEKKRPKELVTRLHHIIATCDATEDSINYCFGLLGRIKLIHPSVAFPIDFELDLVQALWFIMRNGNAYMWNSAIFQANKLFIPLLKRATARAKLLSGIMSSRDGAFLMARIAILCATASEIHECSFFLIDQVLEEIKPPVKKAAGSTKLPDASLSPATKDLITVSRERLEPIWRKTMKHLETLPVKGDNSRVTAAIKKWKALGVAVQISALVNPLVGCGWYKCPLYKEETEKKMSLCSKCEKVQYCDRVCQRDDWNQGDHKSICKSPS